MQLQTSQGLWQLVGNTASKSDISYAGPGLILILKLLFSDAGISPVSSAAAHNLHQCHLKGMPFDCLYGFDMLGKRETCLINDSNN